MASDGGRAPVLGAAWGQRLDVMGLGLLFATVAWTLITTRDRSDARPLPHLALLAVVLLALLIGRRVHPRGPLIPGAAAIAIAGSAVLTFPELLEAGGAPTGYANANATLMGLGAVASAMASAASGVGRARRGWAALAVGLACALVAAGSVAAIACGLTVVALAAASVLTGARLVIIGGGLVLVSIAIGVTAAIAHGGDPLGLGERAGVRAELWSSALDELDSEPLWGIGPGAYQASDSASDDADLRWAHHGYLQQAAEEGVPGLLLLLALIVCAFARLTVWAVPSARAVGGAAALTIVALHATVDHVLHHAAVPLTLALLFGWATARSDPSDRVSPDRLLALGSRG